MPEMTIGQKARARVGVARASLAGFNARMGTSYLGRSLQIGAMESVGFSTQGPMFGVRGVQNLGFLGTGVGAPGGFRGALSTVQAEGATRLPIRSAYANARVAGLGRIRAAGAAVRAGGSGTAMRFAGRAFTGAFGLAMTGLWAYEGYQEEGLWGAAKGVGKSIAFSAGLRAVGGLLSSVYAAPLVAVGAGAAIGYAVGEKGIAHHKKLRDLELTGSPELLGSIYSAGAATMRQRSLIALQNTHINARMAMGNEALMVHTQFR